jgi:putative membrane protein
MEQLNRFKPQSFTITEELPDKEIGRDSSKLDRFFIERSQSIFKFSIFLLLFTSLIVIGFVADAIIFADQLIESSLVVGYLYVTILLSVIYFIGTYSYREIGRFLEVSRVEKIQESAEKLKETPTNETVSFANSMLKRYETHQLERVQNGISSFRGEFPNLPYEKIVPSLSQHILSPIDSEAENLIFKYAKENAVATAISPVAIFDAIFVIWRNLRMVNEIVALYGFRAGFFGNLILLRRVAEQLMFIGVTEIAEDSLGALTGHTIASKLSSSVAGGIGNAILTIRIGVATIQVSRPIREQSRISMINRFLKSLNPFKKKES